MKADVWLSSGDVCAVAGIPPNTLDRWVQAGFLDPANAGRGTGRHRQYTLGDVIAVAAGVRYRAEGAGPDRVAGVVKFLAGLGAERLEAHLAAGRTFPVPAAMLGAAWLPGLMIEPPVDDPALTPEARAMMRRLDLRAVYDEVTRKVARLAAGAARPKRVTV